MRILPLIASALLVQCCAMAPPAGDENGGRVKPLVDDDADNSDEGWTEYVSDYSDEGTRVRGWFNADGVRVGQWIEEGPVATTVGQYVDGYKNGAWKVYDWNKRLVLERWYFMAIDKPPEAVRDDILRSMFQCWLADLYDEGDRPPRNVRSYIDPYVKGAFAEVIWTSFTDPEGPASAGYTVLFDPVTGEVLAVRVSE